MTSILKGADVVNSLKDKMISQVGELKSAGIIPRLAIVRVGAREDDLAYQRMAVKRCESVGVETVIHDLPETITQDEFKIRIEEINGSDEIHGILVFRPLPRHLNEDEIKTIIDPEKDVDCMTHVNISKLFTGDTSGFYPCTPEAVMEFLQYHQIDIEGKNVVIINRSMVVGKPLSMLMLKKNATVTICHSRTTDLPSVCRRADILVVAIGKAKFMDSRYVSSGSIVIDVGMNTDKSGNLCGDVDFEKVSEIVSMISPVPGGIGTVTNSILAAHVIKAAQKSAGSVPLNEK